MDLSQLQYFQTVARFENISQAAMVLHISQPALSRAISRLENEVGSKLFERDGNKIRLNQAGKAYLIRVDHAVRELESGRNEIQALDGQSCGQVHFSAFASGILAELVFSYIARYPNVSVRHMIQSPHQMENSLELGEVDFSFAFNPIPSPSINWVPMAEDELIALVSADHRLSGQTVISLRELEGERMAVPDQMSQLIRQFCFQAGFTPKLLYEGMDGNLIMELLKKDLCVFVLPSSVHLWKVYADRTAFEPGGAPVKPPICLLRIAEPSCRFQYGVCTVKGKRLSAAADEFLHMAAEYLDSWGDMLESVDWNTI